MAELAGMLWPEEYNLDDRQQRHVASQRARRFLRRLEEQRNKPALLHKDSDRRYYTTLQLLKRHAKELVDLQALIEQLCVERDHRIRSEVLALKKGQKALAARQRNTHRAHLTIHDGLEVRVKSLEDRLHRMFPRVF
jgi:hypothetical protein